MKQKKVQCGFFKTWLVLAVASIFSGALEGVEVVPVPPTILNGEPPEIKLIFPRPYENKNKTPLNIQMRVENFQLGMITPFSRSNELYNHPDGQSVHVIVDHRPYFAYSQPTGMSLGSNDQLLSFSLPFSLEPGMHVIRCFPARSYGESFKEKGCFQSEIFYFQDKKRLDTFPFDRFKPYLTYNEPQGKYPAHRSDPLLLDFYLSNCTLSPNGYTVRLVIDGKQQELLTQWTPYYIKGLKPGRHTIRLELLDERRQPVPGAFNIIEREIEIEPSAMLEKSSAKDKTRAKGAKKRTSALGAQG